MLKKNILNQRYILIFFLALILVVGFWVLNKGSVQTLSSGGVTNLSAVGNIEPLAVSMKKDSELRGKVKELLSYDRLYIFKNHAQVNGLVVEILFRWSGLSGSALENISGARGVKYFLREHYGLPESEPIVNNPYLDRNPWPKLFQRYRAQILMQGRASDIYSGSSYYDSVREEFVVNGAISKGFVEDFIDFIKQQPRKERPKTIRNFLVFIDEVQGLKNLSDQENQTLQPLYELLRS